MDTQIVNLAVLAVVALFVGVATTWLNIKAGMKSLKLLSLLAAVFAYGVAFVALINLTIRVL